MERVAVVTGASAGIGAATAERLAGDGFHVYLGARRLDRIDALAERIGGTGLPLDVTDERSVRDFCGQVPQCSVLVNNAGGALGMAEVADADDERWRTMYETNVLGTVRMIRGLLPKLVASGDGQIITIGSISGREAYRGGGGYNAAKFAVHGVMQALRLELLGQPVRVTEIQPGLVDTEFSLVRFDGDEERAEKVYRGMTPLTGSDVAGCVAWVASLPSHVNIAEMLVLPRDQATATEVHRES